MKRRGFTRTELIVALAVVVILAAILIPLMRERRWKYELRQNTRTCHSNLRQIGLGILQYMQDYDSHFPQVKSGGKYYGWADACQPYIKSIQLFQCGRESTGGVSSPTAAGYSDYFYNRNLQGKTESGLAMRYKSIMLGEAPPSDARSSSNGCRSTPCAPQEAGKPAVLPGAADRHLGGAMYGFADGHVKWIKADSSTHSPNIMSGNTATEPAPNTYTFGIQ